MAAYTNVYLYAEVLCITFQPAEKSFYDIIGGERGVSSTQRQYYPGAVADEWPLSRVPAEGGMSFQTPWSSWDSGTHAASFSESCHCSLVAQWWWEHIMCVLILPHLQCGRVLSGKEKRE